MFFGIVTADNIHYSHSESSTAKALLYHNILQAVVLGHDDLLHTSWRWSDEQVTLIRRFSTALISNAASIWHIVPTAQDPDEAAFRLITFQERAAPFEHSVPFSFAAHACCYDLGFLLEI